MHRIVRVREDFEKYYEYQKYLRSLDGEKPDPRKVYRLKALSMVDDRQDYKDLPDGGKERKPLFFCGGARVTFNPKTKQFEIGINHYKQDGIESNPVQVKIHGGCSEQGEIPRRTLQREMMTETGKFMSVECPVIHHHAFTYRTEEVANDFAKQGMLEHLHMFFLDEVPYANRNLFIKTKTGSDEGESSPVTWEVFDQALVSKVFKSHYPVLQKIHEYLMDKYGRVDRDRGMALMDLRFERVTQK